MEIYFVVYKYLYTSNFIEIKLMTTSWTTHYSKGTSRSGYILVPKPVRDDKKFPFAEGEKLHIMIKDEILIIKKM